MMMQGLQWLAVVGVLARSCAAQVINIPIQHFPPQERSGTYLDIQLGTPASVVSVIFDTGSGTLAVGSPSTSGSNSICAADSPLPDGETSAWSTENLNHVSDVCVVGSYSPASSSSVVDGASGVCDTTLPDGKCGFAVSYGTGAYGIEGYLVTDELTMGGSSASVSIGAITTMRGTWQQAPANGIFGVGMAPLNCLVSTFGASAYEHTCSPSAMTSFLEGNGLPDKFGVCLGTATSPGVVSLGGADPAFYSGEMQYAPITSPEGYYAVDFNAIGINGRQLCSGAGCTQGSGASAGPTIVDSGTPMLLLPSTGYNAIANAHDSCSSDADCKVTLSIGDVCINAVGLLSCQSGQCDIIGVGTSEATVVEMSSVNGGSAIIGNAAINHMYVEFDRVNRQVGFAERSGSCSVPCSAFLSVNSCERASCAWSGGGCTGGQGVGNSAGGTTVSSSGTCMSGGTDSTYQSATATKTSASTSSGLIIGVAAVAAVVALVAAVTLSTRKASMSKSPAFVEAEENLI
eukprot:m.180573 g.180573  ORF g.180573 m.180573 type:complete len:517 (+) comp24563_c0_seq1:52-1602(+)